MNERINELMVKTLDDKFASTWTTMSYEDLLKFSKKFAELIVRECANVADENYIHRGSRTCGLAIRLHFGVEE